MSPGGRPWPFYEPVLATLDIHPLLDIPATATDPAMTGYGWTDTKPFLWFIDNGTLGSNMHPALSAADRDQVHDFYDAAISAGAQPLHPPRTHPEYHEHYYCDHLQLLIVGGTGYIRSI